MGKLKKSIGLDGRIEYWNTGIRKMEVGKMDGTRVLAVFFLVILIMHVWLVLTYGGGL